METKFELGDILMVPFKVTEVRINQERIIYYLKTEDIKKGKETNFSLTITEKEIEELKCNVSRPYKTEKRLFTSGK